MGRCGWLTLAAWEVGPGAASPLSPTTLLSTSSSSPSAAPPAAASVTRCLFLAGDGTPSSGRAPGLISDTAVGLHAAPTQTLRQEKHAFHTLSWQHEFPCWLCMMGSAVSRDLQNSPWLHDVHSFAVDQKEAKAWCGHHIAFRQRGQQ